MQSFPDQWCKALRDCREGEVISIVSRICSCSFAIASTDYLSIPTASRYSIFTLHQSLKIITRSLSSKDSLHLSNSDHSQFGPGLLGDLSRYLAKWNSLAVKLVSLGSHEVFIFISEENFRIWIIRHWALQENTDQKQTSYA